MEKLKNLKRVRSKFKIIKIIMHKLQVIKLMQNTISPVQHGSKCSLVYLKTKISFDLLCNTAPSKPS